MELQTNTQLTPRPEFSIGDAFTQVFKTFWAKKKLMVFPLVIALLSALFVLLIFGGMMSALNQLSPAILQNTAPSEELLRSMAASFAGMFTAGLCVYLLAMIASLVMTLALDRATVDALDGRDFTVGGSTRAALSKILPYIGSRVLLALPFILILVAFVCVFVGLTAAAGGGLDSNEVGEAAAITMSLVFGLYCCMLPALFIYNFVALGITTFGDRMILFENAGAVESIRRGWAALRANLGPAILVALVMIAMYVAFLIIATLIALPFSLGALGQQLEMQSQMMEAGDNIDPAIFTNYMSSVFQSSIGSMLVQLLLTPPIAVIGSLFGSQLYRHARGGIGAPARPAADAPQQPGQISL